MTSTPPASSSFCATAAPRYIITTSFENQDFQSQLYSLSSWKNALSHFLNSYQQRVINMGLFSKKDKVKEGDKSADKKHPDLLNPTPTAPPPNQLKQDVNTSPAQQHSQSNSWHDSTYQSYNGSNISEEPMIRKQQEQRLQNQPPGTTVTTTTTTTTSKHD